MQTQPKQIETTKGRCSVTGRELVEGEEFYSALFEEGDSFRRADFGVDAWTSPPEGCFCFFKSRVPVRQNKKRTFIDDEALIAFFTRLAEEEEVVRIQFRFVLALLLMRKRLLRYEGSSKGPTGEIWQMTLVRDNSQHNVIDPRLSDAQIEGVSQQLTAILHGDMGEWSNEAQELLDSTDGQVDNEPA